MHDYKPPRGAKKRKRNLNPTNTKEVGKGKNICRQQAL